MRFHILSFEGCDAYAQAGGIASRVSGLAETLAALGLETHLWFIGDPDLPGEEQRAGLHLHRWCQWISRHHPGGVYDGEEGKRRDYVNSLPPVLAARLVPELRDDTAVVLAEEWHTADAVLHLDWLLREAGVRDRARLFWNANNTFGFDRIDWRRLAGAARITTVSRYMKHLMWHHGVDPLVIPNGLPADAFEPPPRDALGELRQRAGGRPLLAKMARWDPDKRWLLAVDIVGELKREGLRPLLVARGGVEDHGHEVMERAAAAGLRVVERNTEEPGPRGLLAVLERTGDADVISLRNPVDGSARRLLFRAASAVLANSGREPFGLVGLEAMAVGGIACTGCSGEDYAFGRNALVMQTATARELVNLFHRMRAHWLRKPRSGRRPTHRRAVRLAEGRPASPPADARLDARGRRPRSTTPPRAPPLDQMAAVEPPRGSARRRG
jgi:glycosyltransferase involved in cell wall biosynthesis